MNTKTRDLSVGEAARWYARLKSPLCTAEDRQAFDAWCRLHPDNARNFAAARRLAEDLFDTIAADERLQAMTREALALGAGDPAVGDARRGAGSDRYGPAGARGWTLAAAFAGCLVTAIGTVAMLHHQGGGMPAAELYASGSEMRHVALDDGTQLYLDVRSALEVRYTDSHRQVFLTEGRAIFDVAKDTEKPFSVATTLGVVTALGTRFEVRQDDDLIVTLAEGSVTVAAASADDRREYLQPGEQLMIVQGGTDWIKRRVDVDAETGWSVGRLTFRDDPLAEVIATVNRYAATKIRIADPSLADLTVSGSFVAGDGAAAAAAFAAVLPVRVADGGDELLLFRRWEPLPHE